MEHALYLIHLAQERDSRDNPPFDANKPLASHRINVCYGTRMNIRVP